MNQQTSSPDRQRTIPGFDSERPWHHPKRAWRAILARVYTMTGYHNLGLMAAGVAFYAFLSIVPLLGAIVMTYGLVADPASVAKDMQAIMQVVPADAAALIEDQLLSVVETASAQAGFGLALALLVAIYGAMRSAKAIIQALNVIYEEEEGRNFLVLTLTGAVITIGAVVTAVTGLLAIGALAWLADMAGDPGGTATFFVRLLSWAVAAAIASLGFALVYRYGPDRANARWTWLTIGSVAATLLWVVATLLFGIYTANFANYNATYGALGAVVVLLMWLYVSAMAVLIGAEINAEAERQTGVDSTTGASRPLGRRGATVADTLPSKRQKKPRRDRY
ncbi:YihY/virulence factor BrkB family protein [Stakelama tenebrarum]|uniref:YihY/virulence factor BrkB family protein n=1 Tax=Stakelama tenebrarum TaxID=2711215 RepID=A0A6G6Y5G8_9SPHN|nr:YihY/virulence factor BrkB family protein [Sphingosinithalassobacter tenebrarum]QIG80150.1 YihY/virulence factor BrkB family protein [Sphingosinithalassobacter tenebrarum]